MDVHFLMCVFLIIFMLHNLEEIITIEKWLKHTYPRKKEQIPLFFQKEIENAKDMTAIQFSVAVFVVSIFASIVIIISLITEHYFIFLGLNMFFALNIFTHPIQSLLLKCYTPGVWTSILLIIPYNIVFFNYFYMEGMLTLHTFLAGLALFVLGIPILLLSHKIAEKWVS